MAEKTASGREAVFEFMSEECGAQSLKLSLKRQCRILQTNGQR